MIKPTFILAIIFILLSADSAPANPTNCVVLYPQQVPQTHHVQVTWGYCDPMLKLEVIKRDGTILHPQWSPFSNFRTDTGSGVQSITSIQFCDCNVAPGEHEYQSNSFPGEMDEVTARVIVEANLKPPAMRDSMPSVSASGESRTSGPTGPRHGDGWEEPEPSEIQGIDCIAACKGVATDNHQDSPASQDFTSRNQERSATDEKPGCFQQVAGYTPPSLLLGILLLVMGTFFLLRKRH
jgi:hypothetical protein